MFFVFFFMFKMQKWNQTLCMANDSGDIWHGLIVFQYIHKGVAWGHCNKLLKRYYRELRGISIAGSGSSSRGLWLSSLMWIYCSSHAAIKGSEKVDRPAGTASVQGTLRMDKEKIAAVTLDRLSMEDNIRRNQTTVTSGEWSTWERRGEVGAFFWTKWFSATLPTASVCG